MCHCGGAGAPDAIGVLKMTAPRLSGGPMPGEGTYKKVDGKHDLILDDHVSPHPSDQNQLSYMVKHAMGGGDFLLRTRRKVRSEVALLFLGYNLKRAVKVLGFQEIMDRLEAISHILFRILTYFCGLHNHHVLRGTRERERTKRTKKDFRA